MPLVSIIIPTYNGEKYIAKAIESCLSQSMTDFELIIVNDSSSDDTLAIATGYAKKDIRIKIISNENNLQLPKSLNIGFSKASGKYFTWLSDDNYFGTHALKRLVSELENDHLADIVYSSYRFIDEKNKVLETFGGGKEELLFKCIVGACFLYRRDVHERLNGYSENKFRTEDMDFWLRATEFFRFKYIDEPDLYYYRKHPDSLTFSIYHNEQIFRKYCDDYSELYLRFFNQGLRAQFTEQDIKLHVNLFFDNLTSASKKDFDLAELVVAELEYLDKLKKLPWEKIHFDESIVDRIIREKRKRVVSLVINDLVFDIRRLERQNPTIAAHLNKPISWYYQEYEVLPAWYKRIGHILKIAQGNRSFRSLFTKKMVK